MSADELEAVDIGEGDKPRPTYVSVSRLGVQALTSDESACSLNPNGNAREHKGFILVWA